jgi:MerR family redox-sensitive transcriptional activator SoxR
MLRKTDLLTIGQLAERSGVAPSALRFYESQQLIASTRTTGNQRRFERAMLRRVAFIRSAQRVGLTLEEITAALSTLPGGRTPTKADGQLPQWRTDNGQVDRTEQLPRSVGQLHRLRCASAALQPAEPTWSVRGAGCGI